MAPLDIQHCRKDSFTVIGKEGSTSDGEDFIQRLWADANDHYQEIAALVASDGQGRPLGLWGAMSDFTRSFQPWTRDFSEGLYLAGAEARSGSEPPPGWVAWTIPAYDYLYTRVETSVPETFAAMIRHLADNGLTLAGAAMDHFSPSEGGQPYIFFPIRRG